MTTNETNKTNEAATVAAYDFLTAAVRELAIELPGVTFGYIGNVGVYRSGPYDDRSWSIFLPHPGRVGTYADRVSIGATSRLADAVANWDRLAAAARRQYHSESRAALPLAPRPHYR